MTRSEHLLPSAPNHPTPAPTPKGSVEEPTNRGLSVVLPAYNEEASIEETVRTVSAAVQVVADSYEIIVVDDGSEDDTRAELRTLSAEFSSVGYVPNDENCGKGHAIRDGCRAASGDYVLILDADGDVDPEQIEAFVERAGDDGADVVVGSKRHPESEITYPLGRRILSKGYALLVRQLFDLGVSDTQVGMKLLRAEAVEEVMPMVLVEGYAFDAELLALAHRRGYEIAEAPITLTFEGSSDVDWLAVSRIVRDTFRVFCRLRLLDSYGKLERAISYATTDDATVESGGDAN